METRNRTTTTKEKNMLPKTYSADLSKCPQCGGNGYILQRKVTPTSKEIYGADTPVEYAVKCPSCNGGYEARVESVRKIADIPQAYYDKRYEAFDWGLYKDSDGKTIDLSKQKQFVDSFIKDFEKWEQYGLGLYIWSHTKGSGKSFLASCLCNELMNKYAIRTKYVSANNLLNIAKSADSNAYNEYERDPIGLLCNCKLLVIDDLGQNNSGGQWLTDILFRITDERMQKKLVTVCTSNFKPSDLNMDDRIVDRVNKICQALPLPDYCVRAKESNETKLNLFKELGLINNKAG